MSKATMIHFFKGGWFGRWFIEPFYWKQHCLGNKDFDYEVAWNLFYGGRCGRDWFIIKWCSVCFIRAIWLFLFERAKLLKYIEVETARLKQK